MTPTRIADALNRHSLAEVARRTSIPLTSTTRAVTVPCPLPSHGHPDRTPSMRLYLNDGHYFCFGCRARGDAIQWVRDAAGIAVTEAIRLLDSGRPIPNAWTDGSLAIRSSRPQQRSPALGETANPAELPDLDRTPQHRVRAALQAAWTYYTHPTLHARGAAYLAERRIDIAVLEAHTRRDEVGHTPAKPDSLVTALGRRGFSDDELIDSGLAHRRLGHKPVTDFYRQRVLIPLRDNHGQVCGIVGRNIGDPRWPKYKNPPRTLLYDKSVNLYQPLPAPRALDGRIIVVEGTLDAMAIAVSAIRRGVAHRLCPLTQSGRELSPRQIRSVLTLHPGPLLISFDGDRPGRDSNRRLAAAVRIRGRSATVINLPDGADPASWLACRGPAGIDTWAYHTSPQAVSTDCTPATAHLRAL